jgi:hypothetical protein
VTAGSIDPDRFFIDKEHVDAYEALFIGMVQQTKLVRVVDDRFGLGSGVSRETDVQGLNYSSNQIDKFHENSRTSPASAARLALSVQLAASIMTIRPKIA